jgi:4-hydroxybenzoate polyprenyltransferase
MLSDRSTAFWPYLQLVRPPNLVTADVTAGYAAAGMPAPLGLVVATVGLYGGGVVLNDVFDARCDAVERPERPIPGGHASQRLAALQGSVLLGGGPRRSDQGGPL